MRPKIAERLRICKVCFKLYDSRKGWQVESHMHQGQGPSDLSRKG